MREKHPDGYPHVTEFLKTYDLSWMPFFYKKHGSYDVATAYSEQAKERGTRIHSAFEMLLKGQALMLALECVQDNERRAVVSLDGWLRGAAVESLGEERRVESKRGRFFGKLDQEIKIHNTHWIKTDMWRNAVPNDTPWHCLSDLKTQEDRLPGPGEIKKHAMQLAAYAYADEESTGKFINNGLVINVDIATGLVTPIPVHPLIAYVEPMLQQRALYDYQNSEGKWEHLRIRKRT